MKNFLLTTLFLSFQFYFFSQELAFGTDNILNHDLAFVSDNPVPTVSVVPVKPWPDCVAPEGMRAVKMSDGDIEVLWDEKNKKSDIFSYEIKYQSSKLRSVVNEVIEANSFTVPSEEVDMDFDFYIRRICMINDQKVESEWAKLTVLYLAVNGQECNSMNQQLDDNDEPNAQYYAVYQKTGDCLFIQWNLTNSCMRPGFWLNGNEIIVSPLEQISGDTIITLTATQNTNFQFIEMRYSLDPGGACTYLCPIFIDYFGIYSDQCPFTCNNSSYCSYVNSILESTANNYYALAHNEQGSACINFKWNFQNQIQECSGARPETIKINLLNGSNSTTVYGPVNQLSGDILYDLPQGVSFTDVEYEYTSSGGNSGNQTCSYIVNRTFADFNLTPEQCEGIDTMQYFCELNYNFEAIVTNNSVIISIKDNTFDNEEFLGYIDEFNVDSIAVFFNFPQQGEFRATLYKGQTNFDINQWSHQITGISEASIISPIYISVYKNGDTQGETCTGNGTIEVQLSNDQDRICEILAFLLQSNPVSNSIRFDFNDPADPAYLKNKLLGLGFQSYETAETYFKSKVKTLTFNLNYKYKNASNNTVSATLTQIITNSSGIPFNAVVATFITPNFSTFEPFADMEIVVHNTAYNSMDFSCDRENIDYKASKLPVYSCEGNYQVPLIDSTHILPRLMPGDMAKIAGFSFIVDSIGNSNNPPFSGRGILAHPFTLAGAEPILVRFYDIKLNTDYEVYDGVLRGVEASAAEFAEMGFNTTPDTFSIGGEICLPPPDSETVDPATGVDAWGFGPDSINVNTGKKWDENGFDMNGYYNGTGSKFNQCGCSREGLDTLGNACDPSCKDSPEIKEFIDSVKTLIDEKVDVLIEDFLEKLTDSLADLNCDQYRAIIDAKIIAKNFERKYIVGAGEETREKYYRKGMSAEFAEEPKKLSFREESRDQDVIALEDAHVALYNCDKKEIIFTRYKNAVEALGKETVAAKIKEELENLTLFQVQQFKANQEEFVKWLNMIISKMVGENQGTSYNLKRIPKPQFQKDDTQYPVFEEDYSSPYYSLASADPDIDIFNFKADPKGERLFLFDQGFTEIKGLSRGNYLDELYDLMQMGGGALFPTSYGAATKLPLKLSQDKDGLSHDIFIDNIELKPGGAKLDAYFVLTVPGSKTNKPKKIVFKALNVSFGTNGIQSGQLQLGTAVDIRLSNAVKLKIKPSDSTYVNWNCNGFAGFGLDLGIEVCRNVLVPLDPVTLEEIPGDVRYTIDVALTAASWSDIFIEVNGNNTKPFAVAGYNDLKWKVSNLTFDFSYFRSSEAVLPEFFVPSLPELQDPDIYDNKFKPEWKGVYMGNLTVYLPKSFTANNQPKSISVEHLMINDLGVSCMITGNNLINLDSGSIGGWAFSISDFYLKIWQTRLLGGGFGGKINVPVFKGTMDYSASIEVGNKYSFKVMPDSIQNMNMFLATAHIDTTSKIEVYYDNGDFTCIATLNGSITANTDSTAIKIKFPNITFQGLTVSNKDPYFSAGTWGSDSLSISAKLFGFGINLSNIKIFTPEPGQAGISFKLALNLVEALGINADGGFNIIGEKTEDALGRQKWDFKTIQLTELGIDVSFSAGHIKGKLVTFEGNSIYGKGFQGFVDMEFAKFGHVAALALFGKIGTDEDHFKYFMIDGLLELGAGIPLGPLVINGFAGGVSYHMKKEGAGDFNKPKPSGFPELGTSISGVKYTPDISYGIGLKAGVTFTLAKSEKLMHGSLNFEILFNSAESQEGGGLHSVSLTGQAKIMADLKGILPLPETINESLAPSLQDASITGWVDFSYNFNANEFHGKIVAFLNTPEGILKGAMPGGKMVDAEIHFNTKKWYIYIGHPDEGRRCGINLKLGPINSRLEAYLDIGNDVPGMPPIDPRVSSIAHKIKSNDMFRNSGAGFVFGASFNIVSELDFGIGSAFIKAGLGFDMMMRQFEGATCVGTNDEIGINGWYAMGQMWAYIEGDLQILGVNVLNAGIAAVLQAQLPNPFYAQATVAVKFKSFGIKYTKQLDVEFGNRCNIAAPNSNGLGMEVISMINPPDSSSTMPVDIKPEVMLNIPLEKEVEVPDLSGQMTKYKCSLKEITMTSSEYGSIDYTLVFNDDKTFITIDPQYMFYSQDTINISVSVDVFNNGQSPVTETKTVSFTTAGAMTTIPETNILASYPVNGMYNFYKEEWIEQKGYIYLAEGQPELFYVMPDDVDQKIKLTVQGGIPLYFDYNYNGFENLVEFPLLPEWLEPGKQYQLEIVRVPKGSYTNTDVQGYGQLTGDPDLLAASGTGSYSEPPADPENSEAPQSEETAILNMYFRVSDYNTFLDKINANTNEQTQLWTEEDFGFPYTVLAKNLITNEPFDEIETNGTTSNDPLITFKTPDIKYSNWFKSYDKIYNRNYPIEYFCQSMMPYIIGANVNEKDVFNSAVYISGTDNLSQLNVNQNTYKAGSLSNVSIDQKLFFLPASIVASDLSGIKFQLEKIVTNCYNGGNAPASLTSGNGSNSKADKNTRNIILESRDFGEGDDDFPFTPGFLNDLYYMDFIDIPGGQYRVEIKYKLPNKGIIRSKTVQLNKN
jgi:hypothetical protein